MGKGSNIKGLGSSWMSNHARDLEKYMPIVERATGKGPGKHGMHKGMAEYGNPKGPGKHGYGPHMEHGDGPAQFIKLPETTKQKFKDLVDPSKYKDAYTRFKSKLKSAFKGDDPTSKVAKSQAQQGQSQINRFFNQ